MNFRGDMLARFGKGLGSNPGEDRDACKCIVPLQHGGTLNSRRAASPLEWLVEGEGRWEAPDHPQGFLPLNCGGTKQKRTVTCMVLKAKANDRHCPIVSSEVSVLLDCPIVSPEVSVLLDCPIVSPEVSVLLDCPIVSSEVSVLLDCPIVLPEVSVLLDCPIVSPEVSVLLDCPIVSPEVSVLLDCPIVSSEVSVLLDCPIVSSEELVAEICVF
ncbi:uncharacterized protein TNCV_4459441 [Trichonephila clavipes]|nr:uncharacterized protein TNCV_4459441 [Trichonephila clavipes]